MKYFLIALGFIALAFIGHKLVREHSPDRSVESGLNRGQKNERQAQEDLSIHDTQRKGRNKVPR